MAEDRSIAASEEPCHLLELPAELRNRIWRHALVEDDVTVFTQDHPHINVPGILRTNTQTRKEGLGIWLLENIRAWQIVDYDGAWLICSSDELIKVYVSAIAFGAATEQAALATITSDGAGGLRTVYSGSPNWSNLCSYLEASHAHGDFDVGGHSAPDDDNLAVVYAGMNIIATMSKMPWEMVKVVLEAMHSAIAAKDPSWT